MMKETAYNRLVETIRARHTWITVLQADREHSLMVRVGRELHGVRCRVLTLVALRGRGPYSRGHVWDIPEYNLDKAVRSLKRDSRFRGGCVKSKNQVFFDILYKKDFISLLC